MNYFFEGHIAIACMDKYELDELTSICETHNIYWLGDRSPNVEYPITVYYDDIDGSGEQILNYTSGRNYLEDWGIPIVEFQIFIKDFMENQVLECATFLELV